MLSHGRTLDDKFRVRDVQLKSVTNEQNRDYKKGVTLALDAIREYDMHLPRKPQIGFLSIEELKLKRMLDSKAEILLQFPCMTDQRAVHVTRLLGHHLAYFSMLGGELSLSCLASVKVLRTACMHGVCSETAAAIMLKATVTFWRERKYELACKYADLALCLSKRFLQIPGSRHAFIRVAAYSGVYPMLRPLHKSLGSSL